MYNVLCFQPKQFELHMTTGEALVCAAQGRQSAAARDLWTETEQDYIVRNTMLLLYQLVKGDNNVCERSS